MGRKVQVNMTDGDYLRLLVRTLYEFNIDWFYVDKKSGLRGLYKKNGQWIIKDYLGFSDNETKEIHFVNDDGNQKSMKEICEDVIRYVAYSSDEEEQLLVFFLKEENYLQSELDNVSMLSHIENEGYTEGMDIPEVYYHEFAEDIIGFLPGFNFSEVSGIYKKINPCCRCGGTPELHEYAGMGDADFVIRCKDCSHDLIRGMYDSLDIKSEDSEFDEYIIMDTLIENWNNGVNQEDINIIRKSEHSRKELRSENMVWHDYHPNNMITNEKEGEYCLVFYKNYDGKLVCYKFFIGFQREWIKSRATSTEPKIEAYNLYMNRVSELKGPLHYPQSSKDGIEYIESSNSINTFTNAEINIKGDFERSFKTLEEAKMGAAYLCGRRGINRDTMINVEKYGDITAEELEKLI